MHRRKHICWPPTSVSLQYEFGMCKPTLKQCIRYINIYYVYLCIIYIYIICNIYIYVYIYISYTHTHAFPFDYARFILMLHAAFHPSSSPVSCRALLCSQRLNTSTSVILTRYTSKKIPSSLLNVLAFLIKSPRNQGENKVLNVLNTFSSLYRFA